MSTWSRSRPRCSTPKAAWRPGLPREAFEIFEDGEPQAITQFTNERVPVGLGVLLDTSDSMFGRRIVDARAAVERFLFELLDPDDEFFVMAFNHYAAHAHALDEHAGGRPARRSTSSAVRRHRDLRRRRRRAAA